MATATPQEALEALHTYRAAQGKTPEAYNPSLSSFALDMPVLGYSMWTVLAALQNWIQVASINAMLADAKLLSTESDLSAKASDRMTAKLTQDNALVQQPGNSSDQIQQYETQFNTDQAVYNVPVTTLQGAVQQASQNVQNLTSMISTLAGLAQSIVQSVFIPAAM